MRNAQVRHFFTVFINLFFLGNFMIGSVLYVFVPSQTSPVPEPSTMFLIGVATAVLAFVNVLQENRQSYNPKTEL